MPVFHFFFTDGARTTRLDIPASDLEFACMRVTYFCGGHVSDYLAAYKAKTAMPKPRPM
jgi:hypothetical protein